MRLSHEVFEVPQVDHSIEGFVASLEGSKKREVLYALLGREPDWRDTVIDQLIGVNDRLVRLFEPAGIIQAVWLGDGRVRVGTEVRALSQRFANVLQALVELRAATTAELVSESGEEEAGKLLRRLVVSNSYLRPYIHFPGKKCAGGYSTTIIAAVE